MSRILYVHVGPSKTGTSAIQSLLRAHDSSAIVYPKVGLWPDGSHHNLVFNFFGGSFRPEFVREPVRDQFDRIATEAKGSERNVLISSEVLAGHKRAPEFISALLERLGGGFRAEVLYVVRDHFERAASVYNQRVKDGALREQRDPDIFVSQEANNLRYAPALRRFLKTDFLLNVLNYHPAGDFVQRFLGHIGFAQEGVPAAPVRNVSLSTKALIATLGANRACGDIETRARIGEAIQGLPGSFAPSEFIFGREAVSRAEEQFDPDVGFLRRRFGIEIRNQNPPKAARRFAISTDEFAEISSVLSNFGSVGEAVRKSVLPYVGAAAVAAP